VVGAAPSLGHTTSRHLPLGGGCTSPPYTGLAPLYMDGRRHPLGLAHRPLLAFDRGLELSVGNVGGSV